MVIKTWSILNLKSFKCVDFLTQSGFLWDFNRFNLNDIEALYCLIIRQSFCKVYDNAINKINLI